MKRKDFFKGLAIGTITAPFVIRSFGPIRAQKTSSGVDISKKYEWKMTTTWPPNFPILGEGCVLFADWVREMSGGRLDIQVYGGGELVPALETFGAVKSGAVQMGHGASYYWAGKIPAAQFFASVPFGLNAQQMNTWMISGGGLELWQELYAKHNLVPFIGGNTGVQMGGWFNREINSISDLKGLKMRIPGVGGKVLSKAGGSPVLLAGGEIFTGLERGIIDAAEWIGPYHDYKMGFYQIAKYYYTPGWHELGTTLETLVNRESFLSLPPDLQAILETASFRLNQYVLSELEYQNSIYLDKMINEENVTVKQFPDEVLSTLKVYAEKAIQELAETNNDARKVYRSLEEFTSKQLGWSDISEKVYYNIGKEDM